MNCLSPDDYRVCYCHYNISFGVTVFNCSSKNLNTIPNTTPNFTNWVILKDNSIKDFEGLRGYLSQVQFLHLGGNLLSSINNTFLYNLQNNKSIVWLNVARNRLTSIPSKIQELNFLQKIWLSGNPFHCNCLMLWMIGWLNNFTTSTGKHVIVDYQDVRCHSGTAVGTPIYKLNEVILGCYPKGLTIW